MARSCFFVVGAACTFLYEGGIRTIPHLFLPPPPNVFWLNLMETIKGNLTSNRRKLAPGASQRGPLTFLPRQACAQNSKWVPDHLHPKWSATLFWISFQLWDHLGKVRVGFGWPVAFFTATRSFDFLPSSDHLKIISCPDCRISWSPCPLVTWKFWVAGFTGTTSTRSWLDDHICGWESC